MVASGNHDLPPAGYYNPADLAGYYSPVYHIPEERTPVGDGDGVVVVAEGGADTVVVVDDMAMGGDGFVVAVAAVGGLECSYHMIHRYQSVHHMGTAAHVWMMVVLHGEMD